MSQSDLFPEPAKLCECGHRVVEHFSGKCFAVIGPAPRENVSDRPLICTCTEPIQRIIKGEPE